MTATHPNGIRARLQSLRVIQFNGTLALWSEHGVRNWGIEESILAPWKPLAGMDLIRMLSRYLWVGR